jgi:Glycosyltransferase family 87
VPQPAEPDPARKALTHSLALWAVITPVVMMTKNALKHQFAFDVRYAFLPAAHAVLHGTSPYSGVSSRAVQEGFAFLYPPLTAYLFAPLTLIPSLAAGVLMTVLVAACVPATLLVLGVRDWRCHAVAFLWLPTIAGIECANLTLPMVLGLALVWRYRHRAAVVALLGGLIVALKLFFWPLLIWLIATRRYRVAVLTAAASAVFVFLPWAGIGFAGLRAYPHLMSFVARREGADSYSLAALAHLFVSSWSAALAIEALVGACLLLLVAHAGRRGRDRDAFAFTILAILAFTPLLEIHYLTALLVLIALYRLRFEAAWFAPMLIWGASEANNGLGLNRVHVFIVVTATLVVAMSNWRRRLPSYGPHPGDWLAWASVLWPVRRAQASQRTAISLSMPGSGSDFASASTASRSARVSRRHGWMLRSFRARRQVPTISPATSTAPGQTREVHSAAR